MLGRCFRGYGLICRRSGWFERPCAKEALRVTGSAATPPVPGLGPDPSGDALHHVAAPARPIVGTLSLLGTPTECIALSGLQFARVLQAHLRWLD